MKLKWAKTKHANEFTVERSWVYRHIPVIPRLRRQREEDHHKFKDSLGYVLSSGTFWAAM